MSDDKARLVNILDPAEAQPIEHGEDQTLPVVGRWFWFTNKEDVTGKDDKKKKTKMVRRLVCVTALGSNYAAITGVRGDAGESHGYSDDAEGASWRVHFDEWASCTVREFDADAIIQAKVDRGQREVAKLLA